MYHVDKATGRLTEASKNIAKRGHDGPRHAWPHPNGKIVYSLQEHSSVSLEPPASTTPFQFSSRLLFTSVGASATVRRCPRTIGRWTETRVARGQEYSASRGRLSSVLGRWCVCLGSQVATANPQSKHRLMQSVSSTSQRSACHLPLTPSLARPGVLKQRQRATSLHGRYVPTAVSLTLTLSSACTGCRHGPPEVGRMPSPSAPHWVERTSTKPTSP